MALQEWRHWLREVSHPFIVWTDHKNLAYLHTARGLNSRQARWALFLGRFRFSITYCPGSRNTKPDTLSLQFSLEGGNLCRKPLLKNEGHDLWPLLSSVSGGFQWQRMSAPLSLHAQCVLEISLCTDLRLACYSRYPSFYVPGHTSLWISSLVCHLQKVAIQS